jgi:uncharacterized membrane protein
VFSKKTYDISNFEPCPAGTSGGVSLFGTSFSIVGATVIAVIAFFFDKISFIQLFVVIVSAFLGTILDSILGSLFQAKYKCQVCDIITEKSKHCNVDTVYLKGTKLLNGDFVNAISGVFSVICALVLTLIFK